MKAENYIAQDCYHCGAPVPASLSLSVLIDGRPRLMCCAGCQAVAETIVTYGLENYYKFRTTAARKPEELLPEELLRDDIYNDRQFQESFTEAAGANRRSVHLLLEDVVCPACAWLIESRLSRLPGLEQVLVNYASHRAAITWREDSITLGAILQAIRSLGYRAFPYDASSGPHSLENERKLHLRRLGLAGLLGMQVMMLEIAIYAGDWTGMATDYRRFFYWICLILTTPVMGYSARPFFQRAWRDLRLLRTGMDVPVSLGLGIAYLGSAWTTVSGNGQVYYDSVVMFVFLLLTARYFEFMARQRAVQHYEEIRRIIPAIATRLENHDGEWRQTAVAVAKLKPGDRLLIKPGETISTDGVITSGATAVDESIITGESVPVKKAAGQTVIGGSTNIDSPVQVEVSRIGKDTVLANILRLADMGQQQKAGITRLSNRLASWFIFFVLVLAAVAAAYWWQVDRTMCLPVLISVLVITCPCALSLATPVAITTAATRLLGRGLVVISHNALEVLNRATHFVFDKTGTLTAGRLRVHAIDTLPGHDPRDCLTIAAALESNSEHPVARAILDYDATVRPSLPDRVDNHPGRGLTGVIAGRQYYLGTAEFIRDRTGLAVDWGLPGGTEADTTVVLADSAEVYCVFRLRDSLRPDAGKLIADLRRAGRDVLLFSGDADGAVRHIAETLGITQARGRMTPQQKLAAVAGLVGQGRVVAAIGDGINDAPLLARAHVSIAMGAGVDVAKLYGDMLLLNSKLAVLDEAVALAGRTARIIRQNICWAVGYNLLAIPIAVTGLVAPWEAAVGMSLSSLIVVGNSMRLNRSQI